MQLKLDIPDNIVEAVRLTLGDDMARGILHRVALEGYRLGKLSRYEVQQLLGFDNRWDVEAWLARHGAQMHYSLDDLAADRNVLDADARPR